MLLWPKELHSRPEPQLVLRTIFPSKVDDGVKLLLPSLMPGGVGVGWQAGQDVCAWVLVVGNTPIAAATAARALALLLLPRPSQQHPEPSKH